MGSLSGCQLTELAKTWLVRFKSSPITFQVLCVCVWKGCSFPDVSDGLLPKWIRKINPLDLGYIPTGVSGYICWQLLDRLPRAFIELCVVPRWMWPAHVGDTDFSTSTSRRLGLGLWMVKLVLGHVTSLAPPDRQLLSFFFVCFVLNRHLLAGGW